MFMLQLHGASFAVGCPRSSRGGWSWSLWQQAAWPCWTSSCLPFSWVSTRH